MSELTRTILAGTSQVKDAYEGLANLRAVNRQRKAKAMEGIGESLASLGSTFKEYGSWKAAKQAEDESKQVDDAYALGMQTGDPTKALVTLGAVRPTTAGAAARRARLMDQAMKTSRDKIASQLDEAQRFDLEERTNKAREDRAREAAERTQRPVILAKYPLDADASPEMQAAREEYAAGGSTTKDYIAFVTQERLRRKSEADAAAKVAEGERKTKVAAEQEAGRAARSAASLAAQERMRAQDRASRELLGLGAQEIARSRLAHDITNDENAARLKTETEAHRRAWEEQRFAIMRDSAARGWLKTRLGATMAGLVVDRATVGAKGWRDDEDKKALLKSIDDAQVDIKDMMTDIATYEGALPKTLPAAPVEGAPGAKGAPAPTPTRMPTTDELDAELAKRGVTVPK